jgi:uncharacterized protein YndB with AHSA1/START domain
MPDFFQIEAVVAAEPLRVYTAWLDAREHAAFTGGGEAIVEPWTGGRFISWDGYIHGILLGLEAGKRIVQTWRTSEFSPEMRDSRLVIEFEGTRAGTRVRVRHSDLPPSQVKRYEKGWMEHYLKPLQKYFAKGGKQVTKAGPARSTAWGRREERKSRRPAARKPAARKPAARKPARKSAARKSPARKPARRPAPARKKAAAKRGRKR